MRFTLCLTVGETADTLYAMRELQRKGAKVLGICNVVGSTIARETDGGVYIHSGPEIAVASTKAFTSQLTALYIFTLMMARMKDMSFEAGSEFIDQLYSIPDLIGKIVDNKDEIKSLLISTVMLLILSFWAGDKLSCCA